MIKIKAGIMAFALCFCLCLMPICARAISTSDAVEPIAPDRECSLTISYCYGETAFADVQVKLYRVAEVGADLRFALTQPFAASGLELNGIRTAGEWDVVRSTLEAHILAHGTAPDAVLSTSDDGRVSFGALNTGIYLAAVGQVTHGELHCRFDPAVAMLPGLEQDGAWNYDVTVNAKAEALPLPDTDKDIELKVLKLWRGDEGRSDRPEYVEVEIFRDGIGYETVILSEDNNWSYAWTAKDDGASWSVVERNVPAGYTMTLCEREGSFIVTNARIPTEPDEPGDFPETGDTASIMPYALLMTAIGTVLLALGAARKRNSR